MDLDDLGQRLAWSRWTLSRDESLSFSMGLALNSMLGHGGLLQADRATRRIRICKTDPGRKAVLWNPLWTDTSSQSKTQALDGGQGDHLPVEMWDG